MLNQPQSKYIDIKFKLLFWSTAITIPLISYTGRRLQHWLEATLSKEKTGWLIIILLLLTALAYIAKFIRNWNNMWWRFLVIFLLFLAILQFVPINVERIHFILFGALGYFGTMLFTLIKALIFCIFFSAGDEIFQWFLPDRVGDMRDVILNFTASGIGIILALSEKNARFQRSEPFA